jgi:hypothetical protein
VKKSEWILHDAVPVGLKRQSTQTSKWATTYEFVESGYWMVIVSHMDVAHVKSCAKTFKWVRL